MNRIFLLIWLAALLLSGCSKEPEGEMSEIREPGLPDSGKTGIVYTIDTSSSIITWIGTQPSGRHNGIIHFLNGSFRVNEREIKQEKGRVPATLTRREIQDGNVTIDMNSVDILDLKFDRDRYNKLLKALNSPDLLNTGEYPSARFEIISVVPLKSDSSKQNENGFNMISPTHRITGNLTIRGITKKIEISARIDMRNQKLEASASFKIDRSDWNIRYSDQKAARLQGPESSMSDSINIGFEILAYSESR